MTEEVLTPTEPTTDAPASLQTDQTEPAAQPVAPVAAAPSDGFEKMLADVGSAIDGVGTELTRELWNAKKNLETALYWIKAHFEK